MDNYPSLKNQLLIAMPNLDDGNFSRTVTYVCEHNADGAMGIVLNRPSELSLSDVLTHMEIDIEVPNQQLVHIGGPVEEDRGFVIHSHTDNWKSTLQITDHISISTSRDILEAMAIGKGPEKTFVALGYAGWGAGQLEKEIQDNAWLSGPADDKIIFELPADQRWHAAANLLGVDISLLSQEAGHA